MSGLWKKVEQIAEQGFPIHLDDSDQCYYAREYISHGGYAASEANNLISNFKKPVSRKGLQDWQYKVRAISQFASELSQLLPNDIHICSIPSSKCTSDPEYDSRLDDTLRQLKSTLKPSLVIETPFRARATVPPSHQGGTRDIGAIYQNLQWLGFQTQVDRIILIDDVLTTGAHYKACQRLIRENAPHVQTYGVFWAKTVWEE